MKDKIKVVVDTNIFIDSWFNNNMDADSILELIENESIKLCCSQENIGELMYITKKYANATIHQSLIRQVVINKVAELFLLSHSVNTKNIKCASLNDPDDEMFVKSALKGKVDYLITRDFKSGMHNLKQYGFKVVTAQDFINEYNDLQVAVGDSD